MLKKAGITIHADIRETIDYLVVGFDSAASASYSRPLRKRTA
jgi:hypothetical protein